MKRHADDQGRVEIHSQHAGGVIGCPECARAQQVLFRRLSSELFFSVAFDIWLSHRMLETAGVRTNASYLAAKSERDYRVCAKALERFFGRLQLERIEVADLMAYQQMRAVNPVDEHGVWRCERGAEPDILTRGEFRTREDAERWAQAHGDAWRPVQKLWAYRAGANCIRKEIALLIRILRAAKLWGEEQEESFVRLRAVEEDGDRALTVDEQHRLLHTGSQRLEFRFIYQYAILALQTTAGPNELRHMRLCDAMPADRLISVPRAGAKNKYRTRAIPLVTEDAKWALEGLIERARQLGACEPSHYLFPLQLARTHYDPSQPMSESGLKKPWDRLRRAAGMPEIRLYDLRHTGMTRMAEAGVPLPVARSFLGHMTRRSEQRYTAIQLAAQQSWGEVVWGNGAAQPVSLMGRKQPRSEREFSMPRAVGWR